MALISCNSKSKFQERIIAHNRQVLDLAWKTGDVNTAIASINGMIIYDTSNIGLYDTLASLYMKVEDYSSAYSVSSKMLKIDSTNLAALEKFASNAAKINQSKEALEAYTELYNKTKKLVFLYETGIQNYNMGGVDAGEKIMNMVLSNPESLNEVYFFQINKNQYIQVPLISMVYYFLGTFEEIKNQKSNAIDLYKKSLEFAPGFFKAKERLEVLEK